MSKQLYWHFSNGFDGNDDGRPIPLGKWQRMKKHPVHGLTPVPCAAGMHASERALDALESRRGPIVSLCELRGDVQHGVDKSVGRWRRVVAMADATEVLHRFAIWCAARALRQCEVTNPSCWHALRVKSRWLVGRAADGELEEARGAACAVCGIRAAYAAAAAANATATDALAASAAAYAALAAYAAATDALAAYADYAPAYATAAVAHAPAYVDEREMQNAYLESMLLKLLERGKKC